MSPVTPVPATAPANGAALRADVVGAAKPPKKQPAMRRSIQVLVRLPVADGEPGRALHGVFDYSLEPSKVAPRADLAVVTYHEPVPSRVYRSGPSPHEPAEQEAMAAAIEQVHAGLEPLDGRRDQAPKELFTGLGMGDPRVARARERWMRAAAPGDVILGWHNARELSNMRPPENIVSGTFDTLPAGVADAIQAMVKVHAAFSHGSDGP